MRLVNPADYACGSSAYHSTAALHSVVVAKLRNQQRIPIDPINHAMLIGDAAGPEARQGMFQWFGLADAGEGFALDLAEEVVDALDHPLVLLLPVEVILPGRVGEDESHSASSRSTPWPAASWAAAASRRRALAGLRRR